MKKLIGLFIVGVSGAASAQPGVVIYQSGFADLDASASKAGCLDSNPPAISTSVGANAPLVLEARTSCVVPAEESRTQVGVLFVEDSDLLGGSVLFNSVSDSPLKRTGSYNTDGMVDGEVIYTITGDGRLGGGYNATSIRIVDPVVSYAARSNILVLLDGNQIGAASAEDGSTESGGFLIDICNPTLLRVIGGAQSSMASPEPGAGIEAIASSSLEFVFTPICRADVNRDGAVTPADFNAWIDAYNSNSVLADMNCDGEVTPADFNGWILKFNAGC